MFYSFLGPRFLYKPRDLLILRKYGSEYLKCGSKYLKCSSEYLKCGSEYLKCHSEWYPQCDSIRDSVICRTMTCCDSPVPHSLMNQWCSASINHWLALLVLSDTQSGPVQTPHVVKPWWSLSLRQTSHPSLGVAVLVHRVDKPHERTMVLTDCTQ